MDLAFEAAGTFGRFQKILTFMVLTIGALPLVISLGFPFLTAQPVILCKEKGNTYDMFFPCHEENLCRDDYEYQKDMTNSLFNLSNQFDLYCSKKYYVSMIGSSFFFGGIFGSLFLSPLPDRLGRCIVYKVLLISIFFLQLNLLLSFSVPHIILISTLSGFCSYAMSMSTLIITEYFERSKTGLMMSLHSAIFPLYGVFITLLFIYINNWRILFLINTIWCFITAVICYRYMIESPRWLSSKNRMTECYDSLKKIAEINGKSETFKLFLEQNNTLIKSDKNLKEVKSSYNLIEIFQLNSQKYKATCLTLMWILGGFNFYGLILNLEHLGGNMFMNSIVTFIGEMFSEILSGYLADNFGRIFVFKLCGFTGGIGFILYELIQDYQWIKSISIFLTSFGFSGTFNLLFIYTPEVFPTSIRSTIIGFLFLCSRLGALLVPLITTYTPHSPILFGILSILSGYISMNLEESLGKEIEDDVPESSKRKSFLSSFNNDKKSDPSNKKRTIISDEYFRTSKN